MTLTGSVLKKFAGMMVVALVVAGCDGGSSAGPSGAPAPIPADQEAKTKEMLKNYGKVAAEEAKAKRAAAAAGKK